MKKIFKKNQIIITALAVMIAAAGYISYSDAQLKGKKDMTAKTETSSETETSVAQPVSRRHFCKARTAR